MSRFFRVLLLGCVTACGGAPALGRPAESAEKTQPELEVPRTVVTPSGASSITELLSDAAALAGAQRWKEAAEAHDHANELEPALSRYELYAKRAPSDARGREAMVRATRLQVFLGRFAAAGVNAERLLKRLDELGDFERIVVFSAKALALLDNGEEQSASYFIEKGRNVIDDKQLDAAGRVPRDLAQLYYALGESRRVRAERIVFEPPPPNFGAVLEQRCQLLLDAQSAYSDSMRAYDAHWSAMAGYRITELYQRLHQDLMAVQPPANADTERKRQLFEGAVRTRYAILLTKAKGMAEHTLAMAQRTGEHSEWVERTRKGLSAIDKAIAEEEAALAKLPYTKQDFEAYFAEMEEAAKPQPQRPPAKAPPPAQSKRK